uniref:Uncharacterized protein n=1 Tax=Romanomermis culicivorax TaxID=13658 RepID=A0A915JWQ1_ROMCU
EKSCIVNSASASVHPDLFVVAPEEKEGRFDYFDNTCYEG